MGYWFKGLIGAACVVVIAGGGYYFYGEYQSAQIRADAGAKIDAVRAELYEMARTTPGNDDEVRQYCARMQGRLSSPDQVNDTIRVVVRNCRALGYLD